MKALTLHYPWAYAVAHLGKPIENRSKPPPSTMPLGSRFAIHAGLTGTAAEWHAIDAASGQRHWPGADVLAPRGAVVAVATLAGWWAPDVPGGWRDAPTGFVPQSIALPDVAESPWWTGPVGWLLTDVVALPWWVPAKGALGLWTLPPAVAAKVEEQERAARAAGDGR